jgi:predicted ArsR family transcriptional regulator
MGDDDFAASAAVIGALADPARRALYKYVAAASDAVSRDQAAAGVGLPRHTVKFHLDRLVEEGLLDTEYRRLSGRRGPGAGRPSKLYRRSAREIEVSLPERHYDLAGRILADAVSSAPAARDAVADAAVREGRRLAGGAGAAPRLADAARALGELGYEPRVEGERVVLGNCPFHALVKEHTALVCGMNVNLLEAMLEEWGTEGVTAVLDPAPGRCCVTLEPRKS